MADLQKRLDTICGFRCQLCFEGCGYTPKSVQGRSYLFHAVGDAQLQCAAADIRALGVELLAKEAEVGATDAKDAARYRWLLKNQSFGQSDSKRDDWLKLKGYMREATHSGLGWVVGKESVDAFIDAAMRTDGPERP